MEGIAGPELIRRQAHTTLRMPAEAPIVGYGVTNALGDLTFENPVGIASPPGETNRLFVVERTGRIFVVTNLASPNKTLFLDLTHRLHSVYVEAGLLGLAFHPQYATNRLFYVYRTLFTSTATTLWGLHDQLSRFECSSADLNVALANSETVLFAQPELSDAHNGGGMEFGPDGYLYLALGDESPTIPQESSNPQAIDKGLFGGIIRLDVDRKPGSLPPNPMLGGTAHYAIPPDNPFVGVTNYHGFPLNPAEVRTEFYAIGLRNPWRIAFDSVTGTLYCGDVGGVGRGEEVNIIVRGGNYGWPYLEGASPTQRTPPPGFQSVRPIHHYGRGLATNQGTVIVGGRVYRGGLIPDLQGAYVFTDHRSGHIWALQYQGAAATNWRWLTSEIGVSTFGVDPRDGELLLANYDEGRIKRLVYVEPGVVEPLPATLADTGAFSDLVSLTPSAGIVPYDLNVPFWSDHAIKSRWFSVPDPALKITFNPDGNWGFPPGTIWIKHFELQLANGAPPRRLETRLLVKNSRGVYGVTYRWDDAQANAILVPPEGMDELFAISDQEGLVRNQLWHYPSRSDCLRCHTPGGGYALGFNTAQLNRNSEYHGAVTNQLLALSQAGYFSTNILTTDSLSVLASSTNHAAPLEWRVRSYLAANCSQCHHPNGPAEVPWDARIQIPMREAGIVDGSAVIFLGPHVRVIKPGSPENSSAFIRISTLNPEFRMPKVASSVLDTNAINLLREWILGLPQLPWRHEDIGDPLREGSSTMSQGVIGVEGGGSGIGGPQDSFHFLAQPLTNNCQMIVRWREMTVSPGSPSAKAGIVFRETRSAGAFTAAILSLPDNAIAFERRREPNMAAVATRVGRSVGPVWLRLVRTGDAFSAFQSSDGAVWEFIGADTVPMADSIYVGLGATSGSDAGWNVAVFDSLSVVAVELTAPAAGAEFVAPAQIMLTAGTAPIGTTVSKVEFFSGNRKLGEDVSPPFQFAWTNALAGQHMLSAQAYDASGAAVSSETTAISVVLPDGFASARRLDSETGGNWKGVFGRNGFIVVGDTTNVPSYAAISATGHEFEQIIWDNAATTAVALERGETGRIAAAWTAATNVAINLELLDGEFYTVTCYFTDWDTTNGRIQKIEVVNADTDEVLDALVLEDFSDGKYISWTVRSRVRLSITSLSGHSPVVSGIFLDQARYERPIISLLDPVNGAVSVAPHGIRIDTHVMPGTRPISRVEFVANEILIGETFAPPHSFTWSNMLAGNYALAARAVDDAGVHQTSVPANVTVVLPEAKAVFVGADQGTQGDWIGAYGIHGYLVTLHATNLPPFARLTSGPVHDFLLRSLTAAPYALQRLDGPLRIAAHWVADKELVLDLKLDDGRPHQVALYFFEGTFNSRVFRVDIVDPASDAILDSQEVRQFASGEYYKWNLRGHVKIRITLLEGGNVILSGLFFDPYLSLFNHWLLNYFTPEEASDPLRGGEHADPDADASINFVEYAVGSDPRDELSRNEMRLAITDGFLLMTYSRNRTARDVSLEIETSEDLRTWRAAADDFVVLRVAEADGQETVTLKARERVNTTPHGFLRVRPVRITDF